MTSMRAVSESGYTSETITIFASAQRTATENSSPIDVSEYKEVVFFLDVSIFVSGTLDIEIQRQDPLSSAWVSWDDGTAQAFSQKTGTGTWALPLNAPIGDTLRARAVMAGGPDFTFSLTMEQKVI